MQSVCEYRPSATEFPHDNPAIDRIAVWCGSALCEAPAPVCAEPAFAEPAQVLELEPEPVSEDDPIATFVRAVTEVTLAHGPSEAAAHVESLFHFGTPAPMALDRDVEAALLDGKIVEATDDGIRATEWFTSKRHAWQSILRGESGDLSACGDSTLDGWAADLIARLVANPGKASTIRKDLRRRGIAAFGMF